LRQPPAPAQTRLPDVVDASSRKPPSHRLRRDVRVASAARKTAHVHDPTNAGSEEEGGQSFSTRGPVTSSQHSMHLSPLPPGAPVHTDAEARDRAPRRYRRAVLDTRPRRTFAVISHPDAGKSTTTEALALHARAINEAGAVHGKGDRKATVSDWMAMEKARGISITSAALQFDYRGHVINLVDTPGHSDFSEDTYRVLSAVDSAVMLVDAGKGLEPQTLKLFRVCALRGIPVITVINKWDRPGLSPLELMDMIERQIQIRPTPLTWPVGEAGDFRGVLDRRTGEFIKYTRTAGGATIAPEQRLDADSVGDDDRPVWEHAVEE